MSDSTPPASDRAAREAAEQYAHDKTASQVTPRQKWDEEHRVIRENAYLAGWAGRAAYQREAGGTLAALIAKLQRYDTDVVADDEHPAPEGTPQERP